MVYAQVALGSEPSCQNGHHFGAQRGPLLDEEVENLPDS